MVEKFCGKTDLLHEAFMWCLQKSQSHTTLFTFTDIINCGFIQYLVYFQSLALMCMELQLLTWDCVKCDSLGFTLYSVICMLTHVHDPTSSAGFVCENVMLILHCKLPISSLQCWPEWRSSVQTSLHCCRWSTTWQQIKSHFYFPLRLIKMHVSCACFSS